MTAEVRTWSTPADQLLVIGDGEETLRDSFDRFHGENPQVYETLVRLARRWAASHPGHRCGIGMLYEVARWTLALETSGEPLRLNNNYRAFYARLIHEQEPELDGLFETRRQRSEEPDDGVEVTEFQESLFANDDLDWR